MSSYAKNTTNPHGMTETTHFSEDKSRMVACSYQQVVGSLPYRYETHLYIRESTGYTWVREERFDDARLVRGSIDRMLSE